ncbi:MAG: tetratricopeptide repeat protein [Candidatus Competibacter sp.]|nr:tetratricopeptide repeat protein [Candidatus Competibacter sp.]MDG4584652.1 tetratricopeptide repeat protein [Candidatus Competibacter sp.]
MRDRLKMLALAAALAVTPLVWAGSYEAAFGYVQQMVAQSAKNDTAGMDATRRQLARIPPPAHQNVKEARALNQQGLDALRRNDPAAALTAFQQAQRADPADAEISGNLGYVQLKLGQFKRAEHQLAYALSLAPERASTWFNLGQVYGALGEVDKATGAFANTYRYSQDSSKTREFMMQAALAPENDEATRTALRQALRLLGQGQ